MHISSKNVLRSHLFLLVFVLTLFGIKPQSVTAQGNMFSYFSDIQLRIDTNIYKYSLDRIFVENEWKIPFEYQEINPIIEFRVFPHNKVVQNVNWILKSTNEYKIIDSLTLRIDGYYHFKVQFSDLSQAEFLNISLEENGKTMAIPIFPYTHTYATIYPGESDLYIGDEKTFELITNQPDNIVIDPLWKQNEKYEYRIHRSNDKIWISIIPTETGNIEIDFTIKLYRPNIDLRKPNYILDKQSFTFNVKGSRLKFLTFENKEVIWEAKNPKGIELQIDNHRLLAINKTYRLEATDQSGGPLVAEMYTVRRLSNDKILCMFRPYNYHKISSGYLYIKDGDVPKFITNINILPEPKINEVSILRQGGSWVKSKQVYPGEIVEIRLEGEGLNRTDFKFEDLVDVSNDSLIKNEFVAHYLLKVPIDIRKKSINIYTGNTKTGMMLDIIEFQRPKELDFVIIEYGGTPVVAKDATQPILHETTIGDVNIQFDNQFIDDAFQLYGKQFLEIEVRITDANNKLVEKQTIDDIVVCPGLNSPRNFAYTSSTGCMNEVISINDYLSNKTHSLENWAKIELIIKHRKNVYGGQGYTSRVEIIKAKYIAFDVDLSIPAGLIIKKVGEPGFPGLSGISLSMLAQFSFYQKGEIQKLRPFKIGAGFLAKNAFNFNEDAERDLGIVLLGSVYPTKKNRRFSFPLYVGMGYFLNESKFFFLIGPGVSINF
ncbi:hypothetical protein ERX46_00945 [Brumimicrobium glaciale]|uniref:Uncharacterized protein n=1 Tax=Brumimicrobium glaciale TaxID=200475 RepID=A0A4Q4KQ45_9FLAO|nr:hypothetical protein [Brumimicrobium glaciale]RYM35586.1 hypothetical protein ERX46_00945 [Brumimicrobium glaciale]